MTSHCGFDLHFLDDCDTEHLCACWPSVCLLWKTAYSSLCPFKNWVVSFLMLSCVSSLYILDINPLSDICFVNIFSHSVGGLFILLIVSFTVQKLFSLM